MTHLLVACLVAFAVTQLANLATTVYLHRALSHKALTLHPALALPFRAVIWLTTGIKPRQWVAVHRKHHAYTDEQGDPHSPALLGWKTVQLKNPALYRKVATDPQTVAKYAKDLPPDTWDRVLFDRAFVGLGLGIALLIVTLGPWWGLFAAALHTVLYLGLSGTVNAVTHTFGPRPYDNSATNLQWVAWLTAGEGLHNNHHHLPTSARLSFRRGEIDPAWWFIAVARRLKLATVRHEGVPAKEQVAA